MSAAPIDGSTVGCGNNYDSNDCSLKVVEGGFIAGLKEMMPCNVEVVRFVVLDS